MQQCSEGASLLSGTNRPLHLTKDLGLAQHHGIKTTRNTECMSDCLILVVQVQMGQECGMLKLPEVGEPLG